MSCRHESDHDLDGVTDGETAVVVVRCHECTLPLDVVYEGDVEAVR
jgi:hypothetical protein